MLGHYRVLDVSDERGQMAGAILAGLGADVVLVEPPGGSPSRRLGPFAGGAPDPERSLSHWAVNRGKRSVVLDLAGSPADRARLVDLARGADVLVESSDPGTMAALGLGFDDLAEVNPALVYVSVSAFGQDGPKAGWAATDLTVWASSMALVLTGDDDRAPVRISVPPQAWYHAGAEAAGAALVALTERARSGRGQHVDVSAQQASMQAAQSLVLAEPFKSLPPQRIAGGVRLGPLDIQLAWPCADGYVAITFLFGAAVGPVTHRFMSWVCEEGFCDEATRDKNWVEYPVLLLLGMEPVEEYERVKHVVEEFCRSRTKAQLLAGALERRLLVAPVASIADVVADEHFSARHYWDAVTDEALSPEPVRAPGPFATMSATPLPRLGRAALAGEHTEEVLSAPPRRPAALPDRTGPAAGPALEGLKVLDLCWVMAGPAVTRVLADHGATVVRVESETKVDAARTMTPFYENALDPERSGLYLNLNAGKLGMALNLTHPRARDVLLDLVRWADVVCESFTRRAMRDWGLGYERLREVNPRIVMFSSCLMGQTGPLADFAGYGNLAASVTGFFDLTGWADRAPAGPFGAYTDYVSPRFGLSALLAAIDHQRRTGEGQHIDFSQAESSLHFLAPAVLDWTVNGHVVGRQGNADPEMAPHGVYPSAGEDRWLAVACATDAQWPALARAVGRADLAEDPALATAPGRRARAAAIDDAVAAWSRERDDRSAAEALQAAGIAAHAVHSSADCVADPQLVHRGHFVSVDHPLLGPITLEGSRARLSRTPARVDRSPPPYGHDTHAVLTEILGYDEERVADLFALELLE
ncbi:MAG TPA: CoA transferase [Acidimicrobiales bacterium]|nr:CoA transferase [Acidimicrobiales bacterium]